MATTLHGKGGRSENHNSIRLFPLKTRYQLSLTDNKSKTQFKSIMMDAYHAPASSQAVDAEKN